MADIGRSEIVFQCARRRTSRRTRSSTRDSQRKYNGREARSFRFLYRLETARKAIEPFRSISVLLFLPSFLTWFLALAG